MSKRAGLHPKANSKTKSNRSPLAKVHGLMLFGSAPLLLQGEDAAAYDQLLGRFCAAIKPVDIIDEMGIADVVSSEWEALRWRRLQTSLMRALALKALEQFLNRHLDYDHYRKNFEEELTEILHDNLEEIAKARRAEELAQNYTRGNPGAIKLIDKFLAEAGLSIDALIVRILPEQLDNIERINRLTTIAETRRNAMLREIDRRRAVLGEALRRQVQEVEAEFEVVEKTPAEAKSAA